MKKEEERGGEGTGGKQEEKGQQGGGEGREGKSQNKQGIKQVRETIHGGKSA